MTDRDAGLGWLTRPFAPRPLRWSLVELCRRTSLVGWEHLLAAQAAGGGVGLVAESGTPWPVAARAIAAWAGPLHLAPPGRAADRRLARLACSGDDGPREAPSPEAAREALSAGGTVLFVAAAGAPNELAAAAFPDGTGVLRVLVERAPRGRYRVSIEPTP